MVRKERAISISPGSGTVATPDTRIHAWNQQSHTFTQQRVNQPVFLTKNMASPLSNYVQQPVMTSYAQHASPVSMQSPTD